MSISDRLDEIEARADKATEDPWSKFETMQADTYVVGPRGFLRQDFVSGPTYERSNAEFIAHARTDVPELVQAVRRRDAALRAVLDLCDSSPIRYRPHGDSEPFMVIGTSVIRDAITAALGEGTP